MRQEKGKTAQIISLLLSPNVVWALVPTVASTLENTVLAFNPIKTPRPTHKLFTLIIIEKPSLLVCPTPSNQSFYVKFICGYQKFRLAKNLEFIKSFWIAT
jgi:hypothetical protein